MKTWPLAIALLLGPRLVFAVTGEEARALLQPHFAERQLAAPFEVVIGTEGKVPSATITFRSSPEKQKAYGDKAVLLVPLVIAGHYLPGLVPGLGPVEVRTADGASVRADVATIRKYVAKELDSEAFERAVSFQAPAVGNVAESVVEKAYRLIDQGELESAIDFLRKTTSADPANDEAWFCLGHVLLRAERPQEALEAGEAMIKSAPSDFRGYALLAFGHASRQAKDEWSEKAGQMVARFEEGRGRDPSRLGTDPVSLAALLMAAQVYGALGQTERALATAKLHLDTGVSPFKYYWAQGNIFSDAKQWDQATSAYEKALELNPKDPGGYLHHVIATHHQQLQEWHTAARAYRRAYTLGCRKPSLFYTLSRCYFQLGRFFDAQHAAQEGLKLHPENKYLQEAYKAIQKEILTRKLKPEGDPTPLALDN